MTVAKAGKEVDANPRREQILDCAARLFSERGYEATTLGDLAAAAGIAKATLFHYFSTKEQILFSLYSQTMDMALSSLKSVQPNDDPAVELKAMLRDHALGIMTNQRLHRIFFGEENGLEAEHLKRIRIQQAESINLIADRVIALQRAKRVPRSVHPRVAAQGLLGMGSFTYQWFQRDREISKEEIADFISTLALRGLLGLKEK